MNPDAIQHKGVAPAPLYISVPCEDSTSPLADYLAEKFELDAVGLEMQILRWLVDNNMVICKRN